MFAFSWFSKKHGTWHFFPFPRLLGNALTFSLIGYTGFPQYTHFLGFIALLSLFFPLAGASPRGNTRNI